jgi:predicted Fe-Mo cluster-binding NifX family protein
MKIALPTREDQIDSHFGHCEYYTVFTVDGTSKEIINQETLQSPEGCGCKSDIASVLSRIGVTVMLAGDMGDGAAHVLNSAGIQVLRGCSGNVKEVAQKWLSGGLKDSGESCRAHTDGHECNH